MNKIYWHDFCRQCGEYVDDDMGHMCPDKVDKSRKFLVEIAYRQSDQIAEQKRRIAELESQIKEEIAMRLHEPEQRKGKYKELEAERDQLAASLADEKNTVKECGLCLDARDKKIASLAASLETARKALEKIATEDSYCQECSAYESASEALATISNPSAAHSNEPEVLPRPESTKLTELYDTEEFKKEWRQEKRDRAVLDRILKMLESDGPMRSGARAQWFRREFRLEE